MHVRRAFGVVSVFSRAGAMIGAIMYGSFLDAGLAWREGMLLGAATLFVLAVPGYFLIRNAPPSARVSEVIR